MDIGYELKILSKNLELHLSRKLEKDGITSSQFHLLVFLASQKGRKVTQKEICESLDLKHTTIIGLVKRMSEKGLVASEVNPENARYRDIFLTEKGIQYAESLDENRIVVNGQILNNFSDEEETELKRLLQKLKDNVEKLQ